MKSLFLFSFLQGVLTFFAPCAVALLPGYIARFVTKKDQDSKSVAKQATILGGLGIAGFATVYGLAGVLFVAINPLLKQYIPYLAIAMGILFIVLGSLMLLGKNITLHIPFRKKKSENDAAEAYFFGIAFGLGALGCLFPLFLLVVHAALSAESMIVGASYLGAFILGMSLMLIGSIVLALTARNFMQRKLLRMMPYMNRIAGGLVLIAGIYVIVYQANLFF